MTYRPVIDPAMQPSIDRVKGLLEKEPNNTVYLYVLATYYDRAKDVPSVVRTLRRLDELQWNLGLGPSSFENAKNDRAFQRIAAKLSARETEVHRGIEAFRMPSEVRSEGVTYDPVDDRFYFSGGAGKLLRVDRAGTISDFAIEPVGQKFGRLGMDVDAERRLIWIVSAAFAPDVPAEEKGRSAISVHDLRDGRLVRRVFLGSADAPSFLNDLTLLKDGTAFVTDTGRHQVLRLAPDADSFEVWAEDFRGPNGIAASADERMLYVADFRGLSAFEITTKKRELLATPTLLNGIDGLTEHRGLLIGIQTVLGRPRVVRVNPADKSVELLESKNPLLDTPSTGVVAGEEYFFVANKNNQPVERVVLRVSLDAGVARIQNLIAQQPHNPAFRYMVARHYDRLRDLPSVLREFERLDAMRWSLGVGPHHFANSRDDARFREAAAKLERHEREVHRATTAFKLPNLRSEGIAYDPVDDRFYFNGGPSALLRVDRNGAVSELAVEPDGEKIERYGMQVDAQRRQIWTVAAGGGTSVLSVHDLRDGRLVRRLRYGSNEQRSAFNDLTLLADGTAFITEWERDQVLRLAPGAESFEVWAEGFRAPNGIAIIGNTLYVSDFHGVHAIDRTTKARKLIAPKTPLNAIDGLAVHRGSLIAIHNNLGRPRVLRIRGNDAEVLESKNALLNVPSTGVVAGDAFYFRANNESVLRIEL